MDLFCLLIRYSIGDRRRKSPMTFVRERETEEDVTWLRRVNANFFFIFFFVVPKWVIMARGRWIEANKKRQTLAQESKKDRSAIEIRLFFPMQMGIEFQCHVDFLFFPDPFVNHFLACARASTRPPYAFSASQIISPLRLFGQPRLLSFIPKPRNKMYWLFSLTTIDNFVTSIFSSE